MNDLRVAECIKQLKNFNNIARLNAVTALREIGDASVVPALSKAITDKDTIVRVAAAEALAKTGEASAIPALITALFDKHYDVRRTACKGLGKVGNASSVRALLQALSDSDPAVRSYALEALAKKGDSATLPRKILAASQISAQKRIDILEKLREVQYEDADASVRYNFPDTHSLCQMVLMEEDTEAKEGARAVLGWLNGDSDLVRGSQRDTVDDALELVRGSQAGSQETQPKTLLRASGKTEGDVKLRSKRRTFWQRVFGKEE